MTNEGAILPRIIDSVLGAVPVVGSGMQNAYDAWRQKNINMARNVLLTNVRQGDVEQLHQDQFFSMMARFSRSVHEGIARCNLVLLARLITGIGRADKDKGRAETFNHYANMFENLTWAEIVFLSKCIKIHQVISGSDEIKQVLHQKGFFVQNFDTTIFDKPDTSQQVPPYLNDVYKRLVHTQDVLPNFSNEWLNPFGNTIEHEKKENVSYKVDIDVRYEFSSKFEAFLQKYGNLWEDISKESDDGDENE